MECQQHLEEQLFERASSVAHQKKSLEQDLPRSNAKDSAPRRNSEPVVESADDVDLNFNIFHFCSC
jgi:hypothetical protein